MAGRGTSDEELTMEDSRDAASPPKVSMYTRRLRVLHARGAPAGAKGVTDIDKLRVDQDPVLRAEMMQRTGRRTVPQIYIGGFHVGGYDDLAALDRQGRLDPLLAGRIPSVGLRSVKSPSFAESKGV